MFGCGFLFPLSSSHFIVPVHLGGLDGASRTTLDATPLIRCISPMSSVSRLSHPFHLPVPRNLEFVAAAVLFEFFFDLYNCMSWPVLVILPIPLCSWLKGAPPGTLPKQQRAKKKQVASVYGKGSFETRSLSGPWARQPLLLKHEEKDQENRSTWKDRLQHAPPRSPWARPSVVHAGPSWFPWGHLPPKAPGCAWSLAYDSNPSSIGLSQDMWNCGRSSNIASSPFHWPYSVLTTSELYSRSLEADMSENHPAYSSVKWEVLPFLVCKSSLDAICRAQPRAGCTCLWERLVWKQITSCTFTVWNIHESPWPMIPIPAALVCPETCDTVAEDACNIASHLHWPYSR